MKFIYFYSPVYEFYNFHIASRIKNLPYFVLTPLLINDVINKVPNRHHFEGINIKIELIIEEIKKNIGDTIVF
jgi:hypothetical protein